MVPGRRRAGTLTRVDVYELALAPCDPAPLSADERERAARMRRPGPWIASRVALRTVLGERLGIAPSEVVFALGPHGKPELPGSPVRFSLAHSGEHAVIAVAEAEVGVDVERLQRTSRAIERTLTEGERAALGPDRHVELMRIWCRKEALAKAIGGGLGWAPERFDTSRPDGFALVDLELSAGYVGAVAVAGERCDVHLIRGAGG
ncbi:MAG TPA: 4'-phosphopantetheinyl transferase superfamily protein [Solirubrobacter sp.]|nr:4'-phosphopantetheinyl transferase superfamily protein [Solirubrobacter sp.]